MAKKILKGAGKLIGGKKKPAAAPEPAAQTGPIITQLGGVVDPALDPRRRIRRKSGTIDPTILADKLGSY